jgi:Bacterial pre-peptidase C-terminal domain
MDHRLGHQVGAVPLMGVGQDRVDHRLLHPGRAQPIGCQVGMPRRILAGLVLVEVVEQEADAGEQRYPVEVPAGSTKLTVEIGNPSEVAADLDLFLYDPTGTLVALDADGDANETVTIADPAPGTWMFGVDPFQISSGFTEFDYRADLELPGLSSVRTDDTEREHPTGSTWSFNASVTEPAIPAPFGSVYAGRVVVVEQHGAEIGDAQVTLGNY